MPSKLTMDVADDLVKIDEFITKTISDDSKFAKFIDNPASSLIEAGLLQSELENLSPVYSKTFFSALSNTEIIDATSALVDGFKPDIALIDRANAFWKQGLTKGVIQNLPELEHQFTDYVWKQTETMKKLIIATVDELNKDNVFGDTKVNADEFATAWVDAASKEGAILSSLPYIRPDGLTVLSPDHPLQPMPGIPPIPNSPNGPRLVGAAVAVAVAVVAVVAEAAVATTVTVARTLDDLIQVLPDDFEQGDVSTFSANNKDSLKTMNSVVDAKQVRAIETLSKVTNLAAALSRRSLEFKN